MFLTKPWEQLSTRTIEKPKLEISGSKSLFLESLLNKAYEALEPKSTYGRRLAALWNEFEAFCKCNMLRPCPAHPDSVLMFLTWLDLSAKSLKLRWYLMAIGFHHRKLNLIDPTQNFNVQCLVRNLMKRAAVDKEAAWPRDPFPIEALHHYVDSTPPNAVKQI